MPSIKTNIAYNFAYQLLILAIPLLTTPYLTRVIGAKGIGEYSYSYAIATIFVYFVMLGLNNYGNRTIAGCRSDKKLLTEKFWSIYAMQVSCFIPIFVLYGLYSVVFADNAEIALLQGLFVLSSLFDINWFYFGLEQFKLTVIRNTVVKILTAVLIFAFVKDSGDVPLYVGIVAGGFLASQLCLWFFLRGFIGFYKPSLGDVLIHFKPNLILFVPVLAISIYSVVSKIILGYMADAEAVGYFESAYKLVSVPVTLVAAVGTVMLPRTSALISQGEERLALAHVDKTMVFIMALTMLAAFGLPMIALPLSNLFFGEGFEASAYVMAILSISIPLLGFGNVIRSQYLIPKSKDSVFLWSAVWAALANLALNLLLIPFFGVIGAAVASVASEIVVVLYQTFHVRKELPIGNFLRHASVFAAAGVFMDVVLLVLPVSDIDLFVLVERVGAGLVLFAFGAVAVALRFDRPALSAVSYAISKRGFESVVVARTLRSRSRIDEYESSD